MESVKDGKLYIGSINDLERRMMEHEGGKVQSTRYRLTFKLIYYEAYCRDHSARQREKRLKYFGKAYQELKRRIYGDGGK